MQIFIWSDGDLDGAGSTLALKWLFESKGHLVSNKSVANGSEAYVKLSEWFEAYYNQYDKIFICDLSLDEGLIDLVDREKVIVIDHHQTHKDLKHLYKNAKVIVEDHPSTADLIRQKFRLDEHLDENELDFITRANDYDSYQLKYPESIKLNIVLKRRKFDNFIYDFRTGLRPFTEHEQGMCTQFFRELNDQLEGTQYYRGTIKGFDIIALYYEKYASETAHIALNRSGADACFCINMRYKSVSLRRRIGCPIKLNVIAENFCDGGGHEFAAAGKLTDRFAKLLQNFKHVPVPST
jgi:oligoribonuclease NrnB/cAMP/cGMP phosphodiesterase (DHH superfamily)